MNPNEKDIQQRLFEHIRNSLPENVSFADELGSVLNMSSDSVYRRLRGETSLSIYEIEAICNALHISFDALCNKDEKSVNFEFNPMETEEDFKSYLQATQRDLQTLLKFKESMAIYTAEDIPLFYYFLFPELARFKSFYWMKAVINPPSMQNVKYSSYHIDEEIQLTGKAIADMYMKLSSIEIWTVLTPVSLFKQIEYFMESGQFGSLEEARAVCDDIHKLFQLMEKWAISGCKYNSDGVKPGGDNNFQLYLSEIEIGNNFIITDIAGNKTAYLAFNTFNKLTTRSSRFCGVSDRWVKNLQSKSNPISGVSEKQRIQFFKTLHEGLENLRRKIEGNNL